MINNSHSKTIGRIFFHRACIKISYRNRGRAPRAQIKINDKIVLFKIKSKFEWFIVIKDTVNILISRIFIYSAIKIKAKGELLYSILNPYISSDSPSVKSKEVQWVSAKIDVIQVIVKGNNI